jgi:integrase
LRRGELIGLRWEDFDPEARTLRIARQLTPGPSGQVEDKPKSKQGTRTVHLGPVAFAILTSYRDKVAATFECEPTGWLLSKYGGHYPIRAKSLTDWISSLAKSCDLDGVSVHSFRRFHESEQIAGGGDPAAVAARLGHTPEIMWTRYVKARKDREVAAGEASDARLVEQGFVVPALTTAG